MFVMLVEYLLDASGLGIPEPYERATAIVRNLTMGEYLRMLHRRIPYPLFDFVTAISMDYAVSEGALAAYEIVIFFPADFDALVENGVLSRDMGRGFSE